MVLTGAPVHPKFAELQMTKAEARAELGWNQKAKIILSIGGGAGMGPLVANAKAIDKLGLDCEQVVVAGHNETMRAMLEAYMWQRPTHVYGFINNVQVFMRAADLLITKAGPATITEAAIVGLPMVISDAIQYQESPNVDFVVRQNAGVYAPGPELVAESVARLLAENGAWLRKLAQGVKALAQPDAIWRIADEIHAYVPELAPQRSPRSASLR
jgi:1,2-diacylglycerol 3-beta-galactosyltransferase